MEQKYHHSAVIVQRSSSSSAAAAKMGRVVFIVMVTLTLIIPIFYPTFLLSFRLYLNQPSAAATSSSSASSSLSSSSSSSSHHDLQLPIAAAAEGEDVAVETKEEEESCDIFTGEWVRNPQAPYYTNHSCWAIHEHQNCFKYGRPDTDFIKWRWKPDGCHLPIFNPAQFLEIVRGKSLAFVGDSVGRNQMQSLICLLSRVEYPIDVSDTSDEHFKRWLYRSYNFTVAYFWTPHLVKAKEADPDGPTNTGLFGLYLDQFDDNWTTGQLDGFDYLILSAGHWFFRPMLFYENDRLVGCHFCNIPNVTDLTMYYGYRRAFRTAFRAINAFERFNGITFLRTFAPSHFEGGLWNQGGNCVRRRPFRSNETRLEGANMELYMAQMEEFKTAAAEGRSVGKRYRVMDTTQAMLLRPDGHPSRYGHWAHENVTLYNDCVHWCLPGPIDAWNDFLLHMLKMEGVRSYKDRRVQSHHHHSNQI